jgi:hypothetical protein
MNLCRKENVSMARDTLVPKKERTTVVASKTLLDRISVHVAKNGDNQTNFVSRALVNQLEREGDIEIRSMLEEEENGN